MAVGLLAAGTALLSCNASRHHESPAISSAPVVSDPATTEHRPNIHTKVSIPEKPEDEPAPGPDKLDPTEQEQPPLPPCPAEMVLAEGPYCPVARQTCKRWMDPPGRYHEYRCAEYEPSVCESSSRVPMRFCIDRHEYVGARDSLPRVNVSWTESKALCEAGGKRLCLESEWVFACEGPEMHPYPYGFQRKASLCNSDRTGLRGDGGLVDMREAPGRHPSCASVFGAEDLSGNVEEWVQADDPDRDGDRATLMGAWWHPGKNNCRAPLAVHGEKYSGMEVGFRCCKGL